jgi:pimeloyl-ACP methyl ester carboxylesterase
MGRLLKQLIFKDYITISAGQVHRRQTRGALSKPPLYCLHATAYSGRSFERFMIAMGERRRVVAPDTPGYGASDRPSELWDIPRYAAAIGEAIEAANDGPVDLFGYHTGAFIATELAVQKPNLIRRLVLVGVPFFRGETREQRLASMGKPMRLTNQLAQFEERWDFFITERATGVPLAEGFAHFVDELIAYPDGWRSHDAAFRYPAEARLAMVTQPSLVLNPDNHLSAASRSAAGAMPRCEVIELPHLSNAVLDLAPEELANLADTFLAQTTSSGSARPEPFVRTAGRSSP